MSDRAHFPPLFATNRPETGETVADEVNRLLRVLRVEYANPPDLALATAYINPQGFALIADEVEQAPHVRVLLGAEPEEPFRSRIERGVPVSFSEVAAAHVQGIRSERDLLGFTVEADAAARRLVTWLRSAQDSTEPRVEVRRYTRGFLHGKAVIAEHRKMPAVLAGSSNLTLAGLSWNRELNLGYPSGQYTGLVIDWFNELWDESEPFDLAALYEARWEPHRPWTVFVRMLQELYGRGDGDEIDERIQLPVTEFQRDGIVRALRIIDELNGVLVCDEVGLGKTFIAGEVIRRVSKRDRQKVLIVVPAALKDSTWMPFLRRWDLISNRVEIVTFDDLRNGTKRELQHLDDYAFVVVDEAHNLRNPDAQRAQAAVNLLHRPNAPKVMLLTATPVNNSLRDLQVLVSYFVRDDAHFTGIGIPSIADYIGAAERMDPDTLSPEHLFDLMDRVAVRRTRRFIKREYANDMIVDNQGRQVPIVFPTPSISRIDYEFDEPANDLANRVIAALVVGEDEELVLRGIARTDDDRLALARYAPSVYALGQKVDRLEITNVGLLRSALLKRLESSTAALVHTLERLVKSHGAFIEALDAGVVLVGEALKEYLANDVDALDEFLDSLDGKAADQVSDAADYDVEGLKRDVAADLVLLRDLLADAQRRHDAGADDKVGALLERLAGVAAEAARPDPDGIAEEDRRKVLVFSSFSDTITDLHRRIVEAIDAVEDDHPLASYRGRIAPPVFGSRGGGDQHQRAEAIAGFCPKTAGELDDDGNPRSPDLYDLLLTTDVLSEGVNLQQAGHLVSYDLPFNPMRLVQRHGRIDRIGSPHRRVLIGLFFPAGNVDRWLRVEEILQRKIAYANAAVGHGEVIPGQRADTTVEVVHHDNRAEVMDLLNGDASLLIAAGGSGALSGEEYRRRLTRALADPFLRESVLGLPFGAGSGHVSERVPPGYVFCARIGDHDQPWFRFVAAEADTWEPLLRPDADGGALVPWIDGDTLTCLTAADPGEDDSRDQVLPEAATTGVFAAWEYARADIHAKWSRLTDWAQLQPQLPKALRDAIALVDEHGGHLPAGEQSEVRARLNGKWGYDIVRSVREIMRAEDRTDRQRVDELKAFVEARGLAVPPQPEPLPPVAIDDIRVVCWMAVQPAARGEQRGEVR